PLLYVLANELELKGPRFGCGLAQCGSCSVLADGVEIRSCVTPVAAVVDKSLTTLEGLAALYAQQKGLAQAPALHPLQQAFIDEQAPQCGYCYNGMLIKGAELLAQNPRPTEAQIRTHMNGHLCRCGTYPRGMRATKVGASKRAGAPPCPPPTRFASPAAICSRGAARSSSAFASPARRCPQRPRAETSPARRIPMRSIPGSPCMPTTPRPSISARANSARATPPGSYRSPAKSSIST